MSEKHKNMNFLITRLQNIGDALVFIPAVRALRQAFPNAQISLLVKHAGGIQIFKNCPYIDDIIIVKNRSLLEKFRLIKEFRKRKIDWFIISPQDLGRVPWAILGGAKKIAGFPSVKNYGKIRREKLPALLDIKPNYDSTKTEIENCLRLIEDVIDYLLPNNDFQFSKLLEFYYNPSDKSSAEKLLAKNNVSAKFIVSAPVSKREAKNWHSNRFLKIFEKLIQLNYNIVLLGGKAEKNKIDELAEKIGQNCVSLAGITSLSQAAAIIEKAALFIGPDSGPAFIATAMKTPAVVLYSAADYYRWRVAESAVPRTEIFHPFPCNPCKFQVCPKEKKCIDAISVEEVWKKISDIIYDNLKSDD